MNQPHALIIDDDPGTLRFVSANLRAHQFRVTLAHDGKEAVDLAATELPDVVVLDLAMPGQDGMETLRQLREWFEGPVLVLSAFSDESHKISALDSGADDYLTKPFSVGELMARLRAALRRTTSGEPTSTEAAIIEVGDLTIDQSRYKVTANGEPVALTRTEFELLRCLAQHVGKVVTQRQLLERVWGPQYLDETSSLRTFIKQLRRKIEPNPAKPQYIVTVPAVGYRLETPD